MSAYTPDQILTAIHSDDDGLARYFISSLDLDTLRDYALSFAKRIPVPPPEPMTPEKVIAAAVDGAARLLRTTPREVLSTSRKREATDARQAVCYAGHLLGMSYAEIGRQVWRDHSTVMSAVVRVGETPRLRHVALTIAGDLGWDRNVEVAS